MATTVASRRNVTIYLRLLVTAEPIDITTADNAAKVALAAARAGTLRSDPA